MLSKLVDLDYPSIHFGPYKTWILFVVDRFFHDILNWHVILATFSFFYKLDSFLTNEKVGKLTSLRVFVDQYETGHHFHEIQDL